MAISPGELKKFLASEHSIIVDEADPIITFLCGYEMLLDDRFGDYAEHIEKVLQEHDAKNQDRGENKELKESLLALSDSVEKSLKTTGTLQADIQKNIKRNQKRDRERNFLLAAITVSNICLFVALVVILL